VSPAFLRRLLVLTAVALLAGALALVLGRARDADSGELEPVGRSYEARVAPYGPGRYGRPTACGRDLTPATRGIAHPVLPCGAKLFVSYQGREVPTEVVDRGPHSAGRDFELTEALAAELGLSGVQVVRWRFAGER
jgi:rare lipoprotein A (peptidoglycan hydrolase)